MQYLLDRKAHVNEADGFVEGKKQVRPADVDKRNYLALRYCLTGEISNKKQ